MQQQELDSRTQQDLNGSDTLGLHEAITTDRLMPPDKPPTGSYVVSVLFPILSLVFSVVQFHKGQISHGLGVVMAGTLGWVLWSILLLMLTGGALLGL